MTVTVLYVIAALLILVGLAGTILPALPGVPLVFGGMLLAAWAGGFAEISGWTVALLAVLTVLAVVADLIASALGTKVAGAGKWAFVGAAVGSIVGLFFGIIGLLVGPFVGAIAGELIAGETLSKATSAGVGAWIGLVLGTIAKIALSFTMLGIFVLALVF
jgi:uncharacterized protein YqgC (DUF456 family)